MTDCLKIFNDLYGCTHPQVELTSSAKGVLVGGFSCVPCRTAIQRSHPTTFRIGISAGETKVRSNYISQQNWFLVRCIGVKSYFKVLFVLQWERSFFTLHPALYGWFLSMFLSCSYPCISSQVWKKNMYVTKPVFPRSCKPHTNTILRKKYIPVIPELIRFCKTVY